MFTMPQQPPRRPAGTPPHGPNSTARVATAAAHKGADALAAQILCFRQSVHPLLQHGRALREYGAPRPLLRVKRSARLLGGKLQPARELPHLAQPLLCQLDACPPLQDRSLLTRAPTARMRCTRSHTTQRATDHLSWSSPRSGLTRHRSSRTGSGAPHPGTDHPGTSGAGRRTRTAVI